MAAEHALNSLQFKGYNTSGWSRWQQGGCLEYAVGLQRLKPSLKFGSVVEHDGDYEVPTHHFAHDAKHAYDSAGRHPLPYTGVHSGKGLSSRLDDAAEDYDAPHEPDVADAMRHAKQHGILEGRYGAHH